MRARLHARRSRLSELLRSPADPRQAERLVLAAACLMVTAYAATRAWALYPSWFFLDDYVLLHDALRRGSTVDHLLEPFNSHLMPGGRLAALLVAEVGPLDWPLAASVVVVLQTLAGAAAVWAMVSLFGARWGILPPLALYLTSAMTVPAMMWWTAALNQVPTQVSFFVAVACWVHYLRGRRLRWLLGTVLAVAFALLFDVRALLVVAVLVFLACAYFASGSLVQRVRSVGRDYWPAVLAAAVVGGGYVAYYLTQVPQPFADTSPAIAARLADTMIGTAFSTAVVGGPWDWTRGGTTAAYADPPGWAQHLAWVVIAAVVLYAFLRRERTGRAWMLVVGYLLVLWVLLAQSRAPGFGTVIGLEYRFMTEVACALALSVGLAFLEVPGAVESSRPRPEPLLTWKPSSATVAVLVGLVAVSGLVSSFRYVASWHESNASDAYLHNLAAALEDHGRAELSDDVVPAAVLSPLHAPQNKVSLLAPLVSDAVSFPRTSSELTVVAEDGTLHRALIDTAVASAEGPRDGCGWPVRAAGRTIPLTAEALPLEWWARIGYLASQDTPVVVTAGRNTVEAEVDPGVNSLYVRLSGPFDRIRLDGLDPGATVCVDTIEVGQATPGGRLS